MNGLPPAPSNCPHPVHAQLPTARGPVPMMEKKAQVTRGSLRRFQDDFARALLEPEVDADAESAVAALARQPGFAVYRNTVLKGCIDALQANYPAVARLVGEEWFRAAAAIYARANLPAQADAAPLRRGFRAVPRDLRARSDASVPARCRAARPLLDRSARGARRGAGRLRTRCRSSTRRSLQGRRAASARVGALGLVRRAADLHDLAAQSRSGAGRRDRDRVAWRGRAARAPAGCRAVDRHRCRRLRVSRCLRGKGARLRKRESAALAADPDADLAALGAQLFAIGAFGQASLDEVTRSRKDALSQVTVSPPAPVGGLRGAWNRIADALTAVINHASLALVDRIAIAAIFWLSGRTKVEGILTVTDGAYALFREEYKVPLLPPEIAAHLAAYAEHFLPDPAGARLVHAGLGDGAPGNDGRDPDLRLSRTPGPPTSRGPDCCCTWSVGAEDRSRSIGCLRSNRRSPVSGVPKRVAGGQACFAPKADGPRPLRVNSPPARALLVPHETANPAQGEGRDGLPARRAHEPIGILPYAGPRGGPARPLGVRAIRDVDEGTARRRDGDGRRSRALHAQGDRRALSGRRDHRRGGGWAAARRARVAHRPDRRHRELRSRNPALLRVDRLSRARGADGRRACTTPATIGSTRPSAAPARGATSERLAVSPCADLGAATVECGWSTRRSTADYLALVARVMGAGCAIRRVGSGALGLVDVAVGRSEAYCELHINAWDCAAGILLVTRGRRLHQRFLRRGGAHGRQPADRDQRRALR